MSTEVNKEAIKKRIEEETQKIKIRNVTSDEKYEFDNPDIEFKTKRLLKLERIEEKYKDKPKVIFHKLDPEGEIKLKQFSRDKYLTIVQNSFFGVLLSMVAIN